MQWLVLAADGAYAFLQQVAITELFKTLCTTPFRDKHRIARHHAKASFESVKSRLSLSVAGSNPVQLADMTPCHLNWWTTIHPLMSPAL